MEEEDKLEILGNLLECWANGGDGDKLGDVEYESKGDYWNEMANGYALDALSPSFLLIPVWKAHSLKKQT